MKGLLTLAICLIFAMPIASGNGETLTTREEAQGTARIDEKNIDKLQTNKTRERMEDNPRNPAMVESFERVSPEEKKEKKKR